MQVVIWEEIFHYEGRRQRESCHLKKAHESPIRQLIQSTNQCQALHNVQRNKEIPPFDS